MSNIKGLPASQDYLIRGSTYLESKPDFKLVGRDEEIRKLGKALTRQRANNVLLVGPGGVGCSSLCLGMQALKDSEDAPIDIVSKRFFWLDTDGLFSSGEPSQINEAFQKAIRTLSRSSDTVLVIDDMRDFVDAANSNGCTNLINSLMREIKQGKFQAIIESDDDDIDVVLKCHSDMKESFTLLDVDQPDLESLNLIVEQASKRLESHHKIEISQEARETAIDLTNKYRVRDMGLSRAQPERSVTLLDRALTTYRLRAHSSDPRLEELKARLVSVTSKLDDPDYSEDQGGKSIEELQIEKAALESDITEVGQAWADSQKVIKDAYKDLRKSEERIRQYEDELFEQKKLEEEHRQAKLEQLEKEGGDLKSTKDVHQLIDGVGDSNKVAELNEKIAKYQVFAEQSKEKFEALTAGINDGLVLSKDIVLEEFSAISGVPVSKLTQDEKDKLKLLETRLKDRVWGQDDAVEKLAKAIRRGRSILAEPDKPQAAFLYMGPSGVGKTELAKALSDELDIPILRFDMSEYMEKHAVAKLIGAPPGYEGYENGGILTNEMRRNPRRILLFDEMEKAHPDIFKIFLQVLDDARLTDNRGLTVHFQDSIILMTSNTGKEHFINPDLTFEEATELAKKQLANVEEGGLPPELLNRFNGRRNIVCFNQLKLDIIEKIASRELKGIQGKIDAKNLDLQIEMSYEDIQKMCEDYYEPIHGARGIKGYITEQIESDVADELLFSDDPSGTMVIRYDSDTRSVTVHQPTKAHEVNDDTPQPTVEAAEKFNAGQPA